MPSLRKTYEKHKLKRQQERAAKKTNNTTQKSTTDSDEQNKETKTEEVLKGFFSESTKNLCTAQPQANEQKTRLKLYQREPKIKPNYHTKAGGMLLIEHKD